MSGGGKAKERQATKHRIRSPERKKFGQRVEKLADRSQTTPAPHLLFQHGAHVDQLDARLDEALRVAPDLPVDLGGPANVIVHGGVLETLRRPLFLAGYLTTADTVRTR